MQQEGNVNQFFTAESVSNLPLCERVGMSIEGSDADDAITRIREAEDGGIRQVWMILSGAGKADVMSVYTAVALQTTKIRLGTAIVQIYPRHPITTVQQALAISDLAPGRLRLGVGTGSAPSMGVLGISLQEPISYMNEYVDILRNLLWEGRVSHKGKFLNVEVTGYRKAKVPILVAALGEEAFRNAGEISDGAISWLCPIPYQLKTALQALRSRSEARGRPRPPLIAHVLVSISENKTAAREAT